jgi:general stress protein YciG
LLFTPANAKAMGRRGGLATVKAHGREHMRAIGRRGFQATTDRHYGGDRRRHLNALIRRGLMALDPAPWNGVWQNYQAFPEALDETPL